MISNDGEKTEKLGFTPSAGKVSDSTLGPVFQVRAHQPMEGHAYKTWDVTRCGIVSVDKDAQVVHPSPTWAGALSFCIRVLRLRLGWRPSVPTPAARLRATGQLGELSPQYPGGRVRWVSSISRIPAGAPGGRAQPAVF